MLTVEDDGRYYSILCADHAKQYGFVPAYENPIAAHFIIFSDGSITEIEQDLSRHDPASDS